MKKYLLFLLFASFTTWAFPENVISRGDFEGDFSENTCEDGSNGIVFYRIGNYHLEEVLTAAPAAPAGTPFIKGSWYFRSPNSGYFRAILANEGYNSSSSARLLIKDGSAQANMELTILGLTQRVTFANKKYKVTFDAKRHDPGSGKTNICTTVYPLAVPRSGSTINEAVDLADDYEWHAYETVLDLTAGANTTDWAFGITLKNEYDENNKTKYSSVFIDNIIVEEVESEPEVVEYSFNFEEQDISKQWSAQNGSLALTDEHFMLGAQALAWTSSSNGATCTVSFETPFETASKSAAINLYNMTPVKGGSLEIEFLDNNNVVKKKATVALDYKGWREVTRAYAADFLNKDAASISAVRFKVVQPGTAQTVKLCFDNVRFQANTSSTYAYCDIDWPDFNNLGSGDKSLLSYFYYLNTVDIPQTTPTEKELSDLEIIKERCPVSVSKAPNMNELRLVRSYITDLGIVRNGDGTIKGGTAILTDSPTTQFWLDLSRRVEAIAYGALSRESDQELFNDLIDLIIDQGIMYKMDGSFVWYDTRGIPMQWLSTAAVCSEEQYTEITRALRWMNEYGRLADPNYNLYTNSDYIYIGLPNSVLLSVHAINTKEAVQLTKILSRYLNRCTEFTPGNVGFLKPDGCGFHHNAHYNNYMYSYGSLNQAMHDFRGTMYRVEQEGFERFKKAVIAEFLMGNRNNTGGNFTANSLAGRHPIVGGNSIQFTKLQMNKLIETGSDVYGRLDTELAGAFAYFFPGDQTYDVPATNYDGFYQFNYSPIGVYRHNSWVATMRTPTTKFWGAEIYSKTNRFGRYQSHGTLEIVYNDGTPAQKSGFPEKEKGWDWNVVPGATTVHYTNWQDMMPNRDETSRFDQYSLSTNFSGALAFGEYGMYGAEFDQGDHWGSQRFTPTNLKFKKSVYAFDGMLISLGNNISSLGTYNSEWITATNLFQSVQSAVSIHGPLTVNGQEMKAGDATIIVDDDLWLVTPEGTGYYVPKSNDKVVVKFGTQTGPDQDGSDYLNPSSATASKAYIEHGVKVSDKAYQFVVAPATTPAQMQALATRIGDDGGDLYKVEVCNNDMHILTYKPKNITAYCFFDAAGDVTVGAVRSVDSEMLLMQKTLSQERLEFAVTNPDLRPQDMSGYWESTPTNTAISIEGIWYPLGGSSVQKDIAVTHSGGNTNIAFTITDGAPVYFTLDVDENADFIDEAQAKKDVKVTVNQDSKTIRVVANDQANLRKVDVYSVAGHLISSQKISDDALKEVNINMSGYGHGVYLVCVTTGTSTNTFKVHI